MPTTDAPCLPPRTNIDKSWPYYEYYLGARDEEQRKNGTGTHHWSGAQALAKYAGSLLRDTMHGIGEYYCRYHGEDHDARTYEGNFFNNYKHGYGLDSYANGKVFSGLYYKNVPWGPGIVTYANLHENVGFWKGNQLMRLTWKPDTPSVIFDIMSTAEGREIAATFRHILVPTSRTIGETNPALELLKQHGAQPLAAAENWTKLYPKNCTDPKSQLYHSDVFERAYYGNVIFTLEPFSDESNIKEGSQKSNSVILANDEDLFYTWNNNAMIVHMMKHCYQHSPQLAKTNIKLSAILNGPRQLFKPAAEHELDCRTFLLACYLGHIKNVAQLLNEYDVNPNVTDIQGNSALMYAACGNQPNIIHFLVEAGAMINDYNDACCTPLGVVLINYACVALDISPNDVIKAILPPPGSPISVLSEKLAMDWKIIRNSDAPISTMNKNTETTSVKMAKSIQGPGPINKRSKSLQSFNSKTFKKIDVGSSGDSKTDNGKLNTSFSEENRLYMNILHEFDIRTNDLFMRNGAIAPVDYIFGINDMVMEIASADQEEQKKASEKKDTKKDKEAAKVPNNVAKKRSTEIIVPDPDHASIDSKTKRKIEQLEHLKITITQLLLDGADPRLVRCPQPAIFIALVSQDPELIQSMVKYGADVNEVYPQALAYTPLDIAVSQPMTPKNLEVVRTLLELGANPNHRLPNKSSDVDANIYELGPTLLHAVLVKQIDEEANEELRDQLLELLLKYGCDPTTQYNGRAAMDIAMSKSLNVFDIFIENPHTNLNAVINSSNQNILLKMFYLPYCRTIGVSDRLQMLTNLLLFGADPLLKCQNEENVYENLFMYTKSVLSELDKGPATSAAKQDTKSKTDTNGKGKGKNNAPAAAAKSVAGTKPIPMDELSDYKQAVSLVTNCARLLIIRWIQAELMKELIVIVNRFKHRHWNMILKEYKNAKPLGLWLNPVRCLEIWDILKTTKRPMYNDNKVLKHVLCIVLYYHKKVKKSLRTAVISSEDKASIESEVTYFVRENKLVTNVGQVLKRPYVTPELTPAKETSKFNVCFECAIPVIDAKILCNMCKLVAFCTFECMRTNIERYNCHPCSNYLKKKFFPSPEFSDHSII